MTSFFSERTAEYSILPVVVSHLQHRFGAAVPMYFWASREGNTAAREVHDGRHVRMLAVFARRPKLLTKQAMSGKLNAELFRFADQAELHGVPTVAGFPVVRNLFELGEGFRTLWFPLKRGQAQDVCFRVDLNRPDTAPIKLNGRPLRTLELEDLGDAVASARVLSWKDATTVIRDVRASPRTMGREVFWGGNPYNPVYVLVPT